MSGSRAQWIPSDRAASTVAYAKPMGRTAPSGRTTALTVLGLSSACTLLAVYDLFLLATGI
jgi:hypothetical protein